MHSRIAKVMHTLGGQPLLSRVIDTALQLQPEKLLTVIGHSAEQVRQHLQKVYSAEPLEWVMQQQQLGTGHAVAQALPGIIDDSIVLVLYGDVPLISLASLQRLIAAVSPTSLALLTTELANPAGYGRIVRDDNGRVCRITEDKDATAAEKEIREINTGILAAPAALLKRYIHQLECNNAQNEYYLTDVIAMAVMDGMTVSAMVTDHSDEVLGINNRQQLAHAERIFQRQQVDQLLLAGVSMADPARVDIRGQLLCGKDTFIDINVLVIGRVVLGNNVCIGPHTVLIDSEIADDSVILSHSVIEQAIIGHGCRVGPFARIRPETHLADDVHIGNFVEVKKSNVAQGSKINHLSYIGDAEIGANVNIGAGTITCNYDGANKHRTIIGDNAFIGSDTQLIAPVSVGDGATIGAGSTISQDAPAGELSLSRVKQRVIKGWSRPVKK